MFWNKAISTQLAVLREKKRLGIVTDMDGTISPLAEHPDLAEVTPRCRDLLRTLCARFSLVAVISGRSARDVRERVGLPEVEYIGNHGLERWVGQGIRVHPEAAAYRPQIEAVIEPLHNLLEPGMLVEDKGATLSVHYRRTADPQAAGERLGPAIDRLVSASGLVLFRGRMVYEIRPPIALDKGTAFRSLVEETHLDAALFMGDDLTDAAGLIAARRLRQAGTCYALGVGVLSAATPKAVLESADLFARGVPGVEALLAWLVDAGIASST